LPESFVDCFAQLGEHLVTRHVQITLVHTVPVARCGNGMTRLDEPVMLYSLPILRSHRFGQRHGRADLLDTSDPPHHLVRMQPFAVQGSPPSPNAMKRSASRLSARVDH